jgi:hypothetical protein
VNAGRGWNTDGSIKGRHKRSVWTIATSPFPEAHFATYPPALVEPCILVGTSERGVCPKRGAPWARVTKSHTETNRRGGYQIKDGRLSGDSVSVKGRAGQVQTETIPTDRVAYIFTNNRDYESRLAAMTVDRFKAAMGGQCPIRRRNSPANCATRSRRPWITTSSYWGSRSPISISPT